MLIAYGLLLLDDWDASSLSTLNKSNLGFDRSESELSSRISY